MSSITFNSEVAQLQKLQLNFLRKAAVLKMLGYQEGRGNTSVERQINDELFPPAVKLFGKRASVFLEHETEAVIAARALGKSDAEIRELVRSLVNRRQMIFASRVQPLVAEKNSFAGKYQDFQNQGFCGVGDES